MKKATIVIALALAAPAVFAQSKPAAVPPPPAAATAAPKDADPVIMTAGTVTIRQSEFEAALKTLPAEYQSMLQQPAGRKQFADDFLRMRLLAAEGAKAGLQNDPDVAISLLPHGLEDVERDRGVGRVLHVDADEELLRRRGIENAPQIVDRCGAIDREPELGQLERDVPFDPRGGDLVEHREVRARGARRLGDRSNRFAEVVERHREARGLNPPGGLDRVRDRLARDEPTRESGAAAHPVPGRQRFQGLVSGEEVKESLRDRPEHQ